MKKIHWRDIKIGSLITCHLVPFGSKSINGADWFAVKSLQSRWRNGLKNVPMTISAIRFLAGNLLINTIEYGWIETFVDAVEKFKVVAQPETKTLAESISEEDLP